MRVPDGEQHEGAGRNDDLTANDVRLVLAGLRAAEAIERGTGDRLLDLVLGGLRTG
jgi:hypothetical protein